jgi:hypothetical protein
VRRRPFPERRPRTGLLGRIASWLLAATLIMQGAVGTGAALSMWMEANAPDQMAGHRLDHGAPGTQDHHSGRAGHDHEHCLLCNTAAADCPSPVLPQLSADLPASVAPVAAPQIVAHRKVAHANAPRGPPGPA